MFDMSRNERIVIDKYLFYTSYYGESWCALEILPNANGKTAVIATELRDNPGATITNAVNLLADLVCDDFNIDPSCLVWIEHYRLRSPEDELSITYTRVQFDTLPPGKIRLFGKPQWHPMTDEDWQALGLEPRSSAP